MSNVKIRTLHDLGLAAWFGGSLMGAVGVNGAAAEAKDPTERTRIAGAGWAKWTPVNAAAIGTHLVGGAGLLIANKGRVSSQAGVGKTTATKTALTGLALAATGYARVLGQKVIDKGDQGIAPAAGATEPSGGTPADVAAAQKQLKALQWAIPALTGALLVINAQMGEQQRPAEVTGGILAKLIPGAG